MDWNHFIAFINKLAVIFSHTLVHNSKNMQKIKYNNYSKSISNAKLYLDDIEDIIEKLTQKSLTVKIYDDQNIYDNITEVIELKGKNPKKLSIVGNADFLESISLKIEKNDIWIYSNGSETLYLYGIELNDFIRTKKNWLLSILNPNILFVSSIISLVFVILLIDFKTKTLPYNWLIWIPTALYSLLIFRTIIKYFWTNLELVRRHQYGFIKRNKDSILLMIIGAILGSILTIITQKLKGGH